MNSYNINSALAIIVSKALVRLQGCVQKDLKNGISSNFTNEDTSGYRSAIKSITVTFSSKLLSICKVLSRASVASSSGFII